MKNEEKMTNEEVLAAFHKAIRSKLIVQRPKFTLKRELLGIILSAAISAIILLICVYFRSKISDVLFWSVSALTVILFIASQLKNILLLAIFLYQRFAPNYIRGACLFTPCCSEYMRISIEKYGVFKGVKKGFKRLRRCRPPNGGIDEP
ncbi:MAG: membrane protein insertion efficiency factor YidD [Ruminococcus sp.]|nr:membrane protein insertion efficiency factor YidD [Ruminococcus sp.]